jgi:hypothetical protein
MAKLERFETPARLKDRHPQEWSDRVKGMVASFVGPQLPQFYDPTAKDTPAKALKPMIAWVAFPAVLRVREPSELRRLEIADRDRQRQDEYCEWSVERSRGKITRITFTTELPEYWEHLFQTDPKALLALYRKLVDPGVQLADLRTPGGGYRRENKWNRSEPGRLAHMIQRNNNLFAALDLVAKATVLRRRNGQPVTGQQDLVLCGGLGEPLRHSDPQIAAAANDAARGGAEITLANPLGLYLGRPETAGMTTPDGADPTRFWKIERGDAQHTVRARFEVPPTRKYVVGDIKIGGRPIEFGGQVAERLRVWIRVTIKPGSHKPVEQPCVGG